MNALPLAGLSVVTLEHAVAAPLATRHLADLGARVIKIERPGTGDFARGYDSAVNGVASHFVWLNRGKESVCLDLKATEGLAAARALLDRADVFVQNAAPGVVERLGLDADTLRETNPRLVVVNISGYGRGGPKENHKAYDMLVQAESGLMSVTGTPSTPTKTGIAASDVATAMYTCTSVLGALVRRGVTGEGAIVDVSMFDSTVEWLGHQMYVWLYQGQLVPRMGRSHAAIAPYDLFPTADGELYIGVQNDTGWSRLVTEVFNDPDLATHPSFITNEQRVRNRSEVDAVVASHTRSWSTSELTKRLDDAGIPAAQFNDMAGVVEHPQLSERDRWREIGTESGPVQALLPPMNFRDVELSMGDVPALGQHTASVLRELGLEVDPVPPAPHATTGGAAATSSATSPP